MKTSHNICIKNTSRLKSISLRKTYELFIYHYHLYRTQSE